MGMCYYKCVDETGTYITVTDIECLRYESICSLLVAQVAEDRHIVVRDVSIEEAEKYADQYFINGKIDLRELDAEIMDANHLMQIIRGKIGIRLQDVVKQNKRENVK